MRPAGIRLSIALVALVVMTCDARANHPQRNVPPVVPAPPPRTFDPDVARIDPSSTIGRALAAMKRDAHAEARTLLEAALTAEREPAARGRLLWLLARAARAAGDDAVALARLEELATSGHPLAPWARLRRAEILEAREPAAALTEVERLLTSTSGAVPSADFGGSRAARTLHARALARTGRAADAIPLLRQLVTELAPGAPGSPVALPLAEALADRTDDVAAREEAIALFRRVASRAPLSETARDATTRANAVLATLPADRRAALAHPSTGDELARADALLDAQRARDAESVLTDLAARLESDLPRRCDVRLALGKAMLRRRARAEAATLLEQVITECPAGEVRTSARWHAGKALAGRGAHAEAVAQFEALAAEAPAHRLADDALYRAALSTLDTGDEAAMRARLTALVDRGPAGDMRGEALFTLAYRTRATGDLPAALALFERARQPAGAGAGAAAPAGEDAEDLGGRSAYWWARTAADLGRTTDAADAYEQLARHRPLSYYAQQALARLSELDAARAEAVLTSLREPDRRGPAPLRFPWRAELDTAAFVRAVELFHVGEIDLASRELAHLGATGEGADPDLVWLSAALFDRAGAPIESVRLARRRLRAFMRTAPTGTSHALWRIAYPRAYAPLFEDLAAQENIPPSLLRAIAREESGFDPSAVSIANAYGLVQLIEPTARRHARSLDLPSDPTALRRPEVNARIGARYMAFLSTRYQGRPELVPPAYNAGEGALDRWLRERGSLPLDAFVEEIPYDETRRYTRRVIQSYGIYSWLDEARLPPLRRDLPPPP